jgi:hypothetical protein
MNVFQEVEREYTRQTLHEGQAIQNLENGVFETLADIPLELKRLVSRMKDVGNEAMAAVEKPMRAVDHEADWRSFEKAYGQWFPDGHTIKITEQNHPNEDQFLRFQLCALPNLQLQHTFRTPINRYRLTDFRKLKRSLSRKKHYGTTGTEWTLSEAGHLIEYNIEQCRLTAMWDLSKCKLVELDEDEEWGYFVLRGARLKGGKSRSVMGKTKEYKFRLPIGEAVEAYTVLGGFLQD